ncbi:unnamed protein product [Meloidogyne enterolobii]|uniref:Uncharacterized protein n=1 Tax=Meloidogyne enterolobii TaxID=390850 RepID=A0ACB0ZRF5_MELEN
MKFIGVEENDFKYLNLANDEWFDFKKAALDLFNLNKLTFTEVHTIISSLHGILKKKETTIKIKELKEQLQNVKTIYWKAKSEIEKLKIIKNAQQKLIVKKELSRIETSIKLKTKLNECLLSVYVLKFVVLQENRENDLLEEEGAEKEVENDKNRGESGKVLNEKFFLNFKNKCENTEKIEKMGNSKKLNLENLIEKINEYENKLKDKIKNLEKKNDLIVILNKNNSEFENKMEEKIKEYVDRLMSKLLFLIDNYEKIQRKKEKEIGESSQRGIEESVIINETINTSSLSAILYCLTNKFLEMFNEDGVVNMDILLQNISNTNLMEYGLEMSGKLGKKRVDKMYYKHVLDIYSGIYLKFKTKEDFENELKNNSNNYCYIDKNILDFERTEEWAVNYYDEIGMQKDGFRLAYLEGIDINENKMITSKQKEEIFEEILSNSKLHKVTFTEAHKLIESKIKSKILTETIQSGLEHPTEIESLGNNENINQQEKQLKNYSETIGFELDKVKFI